MAYDRQRVVAFLHRLGYTQAADDAARVLPDPVSLKQFWKLADQHHMEQILFDRLMSAASRYRRRTQQVTKEAWDKLHAEFTAGADWARNVSELTWSAGPSPSCTPDTTGGSVCAATVPIAVLLARG
jgi:hypothetical protein